LDSIWFDKVFRIKYNKLGHIKILDDDWWYKLSN
jgi:hypothetical protein